MDHATSDPHQAVLAADTTADIEQRQVDRWRRLSPLERLRIVSDTTRADREGYTLQRYEWGWRQRQSRLLTLNMRPRTIDIWFHNPLRDRF